MFLTSNSRPLMLGPAPEPEGWGIMLATESPVRDHEDRKVSFHINFDDPERLNYVLNNAETFTNTIASKEKRSKSASSPTGSACTCCARIRRR